MPGCTMAPSRPKGMVRMPRHLPLAALLTAGAGATHLAAAVPHFSSNPTYGVLFVVAGWTQILLAAVLLTSARTGVAWAAVAVNTAAVVSWAVSRTVGLPLAHPEPVLLADALTVALEFAAVGVLVARLRGASFGLRAGQISAVSLVAVLALAAGGSTVAIADLSSNGHAHGSEPDGQAHGAGSHDAGGHEGSAEDPQHASSEDDGTKAAEPAHEHPDGTVHVHEAGKPHVHPDQTVHVHAIGSTTPSGDGGHEDDGHSHDHSGGS